MTALGRYGLFGITVVVALGASGLGVWQLKRLADRRAANRAALAQRDLPTIDLNRESPPADLAYRSVAGRGRFDFDNELVLRGRLLRGTPGIQVVTPFLPAGRDTAVLVNRGFLPTADAGPPAPRNLYPEPERLEIHGTALRTPDEGDGHPLQTPHGESWARIDRSALMARLPYPIAPYYVVLGMGPEDGPDHGERGSVLPIRVEPPPLDDGPHLSYAVQWFMIAAAALGFGMVFVLRGQPSSTAPDVAPPPADRPRP
ncbi:MAG: SURF1 family protein [Gemmatimonadales bacterium]